jgi:hypothetical protein
VTDNGLIAWTTGQGMTPANMGEALKLAEMLAASAFVPACYKGKPGDIIAALQMGSEVGLKPMQALQSIAVINGRPSIWGDGYQGLLLSSPVYDRHEESYTGSGTTRKAICKVWRKGNPVPFEGTFGYADAQVAGYLAKDTYKQHPDRMYMWRARHAAGQAGFSDVMKGLIPAEIADDYPPVEVVSKVVQPRRKSAPPPPPEPAVVVEAPQPPEDAPGDAQEPPESPEAQPSPEAPPTGNQTPPASTCVRVISEKQRKFFYAMCKKADKSDDQIKAYIVKMGLTRTDQIPAAEFDTYLAWANLPAAQS